MTDPISPPPATTGPTDASAPQHGLIARQPIVNRDRTVVGYELFDRSTAQNAFNPASDVALVFNAMAHSGKELPVGSTDIFINTLHESLTGAQLDLLRPEKTVLELGPVAGHAVGGIEALVPALTQLRERGFRLAFGQTVVAPVYAPWQALADFVKLDVTAIKPEQLRALVIAAKQRTKAVVVAEKVETQAVFDALQEYGATLFQGYWVAHPDVVQTKVVRPAHASVLQLFNLVRSEAEVQEIEQVLKKDAVLGFNLLRLINSAGYALSEKVTSFRQAVMLLGHKRLARWAAVLLTVVDGGTPGVVGTTAVVRGRMMELMGQGTLTPQECDEAFVVGMFSLLDELLGMPMVEALALVSLQPTVVQALLEGSGKYGAMLALAKACETNDDATFAAKAAELNFTSRHINIAHLEALVWADNLQAEV